MKFDVRDYLTDDDFEPIFNLLEGTGFFYEYEINICMRMMEDTLYVQEDDEDDYMWLVAEDENDNIIGFVCYGKNPLSTHSWDVYWIAVDKKHRDRKVGTYLLKECERRILMQGGVYIWIETSGREKYEPTQRFYENKEYDKMAELPEYYDKGDSKIVYRKKIG